MTGFPCPQAKHTLNGLLLIIYVYSINACLFEALFPELALNGHDRGVNVALDVEPVAAKLPQAVVRQN